MPGGREEPLVSVGIPVFNEESSLPAALGSLLAQTYERLQVIVCDNSSSDGTLEVAHDFASRDARVEVHGSEENRGAACNFNRCFRLARGPYFTWASGHDARLPGAIARCVAALEDDARLVLCYPSALWRRADGAEEPVLDDGLDTSGLTPRERLRWTVERLSTCNAVHGVIRSRSLAATRLFRGCVGSDHVLLAELSLLGEFRQLEDILFIRVENRPPEPDDERLARTLEMVGGRRGAPVGPYTLLGVEHALGAWHVSAGVAKPANAGLASLWYGRRWRRQLAAEWHVQRLAQATASAWRRVRRRPSSRSARAT
jgi:glycosyltransferase involved in cell wall biosynthesis